MGRTKKHALRRVYMLYDIPVKYSKLRVAIFTVIHLCLAYGFMFISIDLSSKAWEGEREYGLIDFVALSIWASLFFPASFLGEIDVIRYLTKSVQWVLGPINSLLWGFIIEFVFTRIKKNYSK